MPFLTSLRRALLAATLFFAFTTAQTCYYPDGSTAASDTACSTSEGESSCCGANSLCLSNGLCYAGGIVTRGSCTDQSWGSSACASFCKTVNADSEVAISPCTSGESSNKFVCGVNGTSCSDDSSTFSIPSNSGSLVLRPSQIAQLVGSAIQTTTSSAIASAVASGTGSHNGTFTVGDMAGLGVGLGLPLLIALATIVVLLRKRRGSIMVSHPNSMYKLPDEPKDNYAFQPPPPVGQNSAYASNRSSHSSSAGSHATASQRGSMRTDGAGSALPSPSSRPAHAHSQTFLERYETMKRAQPQTVIIPPGLRHELDSPSAERPRYELSENRMST